MRVLWIAGIVLAGCSYEPSLLPDVAPDTVGDQDGDGVNDVLDNCPTMPNGDQRDTDGDEKGDVCDFCPHIASTTDPDGDGDGVGDACDPRPTTAGDRRVFWDPFDSNTAISGWVESGTGGGTWAVSNGAVRQQVLGADSVLTAPTTYQRPYVATKITISALGSAAWIGFRTAASGSSKYYLCLMQFGSSVLATSYSQGSQNDNQTMPWSGTFTAGAEMTLTQNLAGGNTCKAQQGTTAMTTSMTPSLTSSAGAFQLYTRDASAAYDYLFIVEIGP